LAVVGAGRGFVAEERSGQDPIGRHRRDRLRVLPRGGLVREEGPHRTPGSVEAFFEEALGTAGIQLLPLTPKIAAQAAALPDLHRDPMDRVIIATAIGHGAELISKDDQIAKYPGVVVLWND
jgi:predicted nucleic acid-binding protein